MVHGGCYANNYAGGVISAAACGVPGHGQCIQAATHIAVANVRLVRGEETLGGGSIAAGIEAEIILGTRSQKTRKPAD